MSLYLLSKNLQIGNKGEQLACNFLLEHNYVILEKNWRYKKSEIDIIAKKQNTIHFVEVKTRSSNHFIQPEEAVTLKKQKQILLGANEYINQLNYEADIQFDIITVLLDKQIEIKHIKEAFYPIL